MKRINGLKCRECGAIYPEEPVHVCEFCFGPLEVVYDYEAIAKSMTRKSIEQGPKSLWRYADLLPVNGGNHTVGLYSGFSPLVRAYNLEKSWE